MATRLGRATSTVSREVAWSGSRHGYRAWRADREAIERGRRPKPAKLAVDSRLCREVERGLQAHWSPQQIAARLVCDYLDDLDMRASHETIYRTLFVQARGALRNENTNGLLRQYFPHKADLSLHSAAHLNAVARELNNRPRQTLKWMKPSEVFSRTVASID
jgi:IS30 family transposase